MSAPPIPHRRRKPQPLHEYDEDQSEDQYQYQYQSQSQYSQHSHNGLNPISVKGRGQAHEQQQLVKNILEDAPETTIGKNVKLKGDITFERLLRVDGEFEGKLDSKGDLIIGKYGSVKGDLVDMGVVICEGKVLGNITVERLEVRGKASIFGNITCKSMKLDPSATVVGQVNVNPFAPSKINENGDVISGEDSISDQKKEIDDKQANPSTESNSLNKQDGSGDNGGEQKN